MTGAEENMGACYPEADFHRYIVEGAKLAGVFSCIGDGTPDFKLLGGAAALREHSVKGAVFIKPYPDNKIIERYEMVEDAVSIAGIDIDSWNIKTMAGKVFLERKRAEQLVRLKKHFHHPFALKGIASAEDLELVREVKPDIVYVSNHGGRVKDGMEGTAYFLKAYAKELRKHCAEIWIDGGIRNINHLYKAKALGADRALIGRPFIQGTAVLKEEGVQAVLESMFGL
jgi:isopentenyl diphosphate isomerase/L-lactate dehydrogenase-like FMN-dependent dehydrogenase